jgi:hypothetical protein
LQTTLIKFRGQVFIIEANALSPDAFASCKQVAITRYCAMPAAACRVEYLKE